MNEKHLVKNNSQAGIEWWCDESNGEVLTHATVGGSRADSVDDPHDSTCPPCLREAATFGAKAAVRCMAVENAESMDEELKAERDAAIESATRVKRALMMRNLFVCEQCGQTRTLSLQAGYQVPGDPPLVWCSDCKVGA